MASLESAVSLIVAVTELAAVRAVTNAINANLPKDGPLGTIRPPDSQFDPRPGRSFTYTPPTYVEPRPVFQPAPSYGSRFDYYDRFGCGCQCDVSDLAPAASVDAWTMEGPTRSGRSGPFDPPWRHLPPVDNAGTVVKLNVIRPKVDVVRKGMLIDLFA